MKLGHKHVAALILAILLAGIGIAKLTGYWVTESTKQPVTIKEGEFAGLPNPADIRGSYAFSDVAKAFDIPAETLLKAFQLEGRNPDTTKLKDLENLFANPELEIGRSSVEYFVSLWTNIPTANADAQLPATAADVLRAEGKLSAEEEAALANRVVQITLGEIAQTSLALGESAAPDASAAPGTSSSSGKAESDAAITGKTTFQQVLDLGLTKEVVTEIVGSMPDTLGMTVKDYAIAQGLDFSAIKAKLIEALPQP